jgi:DNA polymerase III delta prime subunit
MTDNNTQSASSTLLVVPHGTDRAAEGRRRAALLLARSPQETDLVLRGGHPDLIELSAPEGKERIGIAQVREVIHQAQFAPAQASQKVCLLPRAEQLTPEAANALLKVLEEPPRGLVFLFLAENPGDLLSTIVSRSQVVRVKPTIESHSISRLIASGYKEDEARYLMEVVESEAELDNFLSHQVDLVSARKEATAVAGEATTSELVALTIGDDPIVRREATALFVKRLIRGERELAVAGAISISRAGREAAARLLNQLLNVSFSALRDRVREEDDPHAQGSFLSSIDPQVWSDTCRRIQRAQRALDRYTYLDGIFLSLFLGMIRGE